MNQTEETLSNFENWQQCDVMDLAKTFFAAHTNQNQLSASEQGQFTKVTQMAIGEQELAKLLFENLDPSQNTFKIEMGLQSVENGRKIFAPDFIVKNGTDENRCTFKWKTKLPHDAAVIPHQLMEDLTNNWKDLENHLLDDVFMAKDQKTGTMKRLMSYNFSSKSKTANHAFYEFLFELIDKGFTIHELVLHLGVDFNKFKLTDRYSFSPIIEVKFKKPEDTLSPIPESRLLALHQKGIRFESGLTTTEGTGYVEYISPCPSTCD